MNEPTGNLLLFQPKRVENFPSVNFLSKRERKKFRFNDICLLASSSNIVKKLFIWEY